MRDASPPTSRLTSDGQKHLVVEAVSSVSTIPRSVAHCVSLQCKWVVDRGWPECVPRRAHCGHSWTLYRPFRRCSVPWRIVCQH